jgi:hypothetical protein
MIDLDKLNSAAADQAVAVAFDVINTIQNRPAELQVQGVAILLLLLAKKHVVNVRTLLEMADHAQWCAMKQNPQIFRAILAYIEGEL